MRAMERYIADIRSWMINDRLLLNDDKTKLDRSSCLRVGDNDIRSVACARNLGVWFEEKMSMSTHINKASSSASSGI